MVRVKLEASPTSHRRDQLAEAICDWVLEHGVGSLSLRPLARALKTSTYSLVYWFGSREGVVAAALERSERRQLEMVRGWAEEAGFVAPGDILRRYWRWSVTAEGRPYLTLFVELTGLAQRSDELRGYVERVMRPWRALLEAVLSQAGADAGSVSSRATLLAATISGLQVDLATSGDVERTSTAVESLAAELDALGRLPLPSLDEPWQALVGPDGA